jgi:hypothetical protein
LKPAAQKEPRQRVGARPGLDEDSPHQDAGRARDEVPEAARQPLATATGQVATGDHQVGPGALGREHGGDGLGRVLQVRVHHTDQASAPLSQAQNHRGAEASGAPLRVAVEHSDAAIALCLAGQQLRRLVIAVVDEDQLEFDPIEGGLQP